MAYGSPGKAFGVAVRAVKIRIGDANVVYVAESYKYLTLFFILDA